MRLLLNLKKGTQTIIFPSPLKVSVLKVNKAQIFWTLYNVGDEEKILLDSTEEEVPTGFYSFDDLKEFLESKNVSVVLEKSGKVTLTPPTGKTLNLKNIGLLLGFNKDFSFNDKQTSPYIVNILGGNSINIFCNRINNYKNFDMGKRSEKLCQVLMPTISVYGMASTHALETSVMLENGETTMMDFIVIDNSFVTDKDSYNIYLDCELV